MSMRISSGVLGLLVLAGCDGSAADRASDAQLRADAANAGRIECMATGERKFRRDCTVDRTRAEDGGLILTVSHPQGSFRRLRVVDDGRGVIAADGAEEAQVSVLDEGGIEVTLAGERYRLPATVKSQ